MMKRFGLIVAALSANVTQVKGQVQVTVWNEDEQIGSRKISSEDWKSSLSTTGYASFLLTEVVGWGKDDQLKLHEIKLGGSVFLRGDQRDSYMPFESYIPTGSEAFQFFGDTQSIDVKFVPVVHHHCQKHQEEDGWTLGFWKDVKFTQPEKEWEYCSQCKIGTRGLKLGDGVRVGKERTA